ncbi:MAG: hypothetical protein WAU42_04925 [Solirubrobacteraceae bacterium]
MRRPPIPLVLGLLACGVCACGSSGEKTASSARASSDAAIPASRSETAKLLKVDADRDNDYEAGYDDTNNDSSLNFGHPADASDQRAIVSLVERYYRIALAEDGAKACSMIYSTLAEATPEDYGSYAGPAYMRGNSCPVVLTELFEHFHAVLATELPKLKVLRVRLEEHHGNVILSFGGLPEREIAVTREGPRRWKIATLLDSELP